MEIPEISMETLYMLNLGLSTDLLLNGSFFAAEYNIYFLFGDLWFVPLIYQPVAQINKE